jgi:hypothetical protein
MTDVEQQQLDAIGRQERLCQGAEAELARLKSETKVARELVSEQTAKLRALVRQATDPNALPLFEEPERPPEWYLDGVGVKRCDVCRKVWPCGLDHATPPADVPPASDQASA